MERRTARAFLFRMRSAPTAKINTRKVDAHRATGYVVVWCPYRAGATHSSALSKVGVFGIWFDSRGSAESLLGERQYHVRREAADRYRCGGAGQGGFGDASACAVSV